MKFGTMSLVALMLSVALIPQAAIPASCSTIEGVWKTDCMPIGMNGRHGFITRMEITRSEIIATAQIYAHSSCDTPTVRNDYRGTLADVKPEKDGVTTFDHVVKAITLTANHSEVVTIYNAGNPGSGCGMGGGWVLGVTRAVDGRTCAPWTYPAIGTRLYERAWITGDQLRIGSFPAAWDNTTPEKRPTAPGLMVFHRAG